MKWYSYFVYEFHTVCLGVGRSFESICGFGINRTCGFTIKSDCLQWITIRRETEIEEVEFQQVKEINLEIFSIKVFDYLPKVFSMKWKKDIFFVDSLLRYNIWAIKTIS